MVRDAEATRTRILDAAVAEFSSSGLAGARIDRIAEAAQANKRSIYVYYGSKEGLFQAALDHVLLRMVEDVPLTEDDLAGYAGRVFDYLLVHPEAFRLNMWRQLERPAESRTEEVRYEDKVAAMRKGAAAASGLPPTDLIVLVYGLSIGWFTSPPDLLVADGSDPTSAERLARHRAALVEAARRLVTP